MRRGANGLCAWLWPSRQVLDVQGAELQVLRGMEALLRSPALHTAVIEVSGTELYRGQALQAEVVAFMRGRGFQCVKDCACEFHCDFYGILSSPDGHTLAID